jgi:hypothetical protein
MSAVVFLNKTNSEVVAFSEIERIFWIYIFLLSSPHFNFFTLQAGGPLQKKKAPFLVWVKNSTL